MSGAGGGNGQKKRKFSVEGGGPGGEQYEFPVRMDVPRGEKEGGGGVKQQKK